MRIWSVHPKYLDAKGLVALWRETLLAKHVLEGKTKGYRNHPQLIRFKQQPKPVDCINQYLSHVYREACNRGYNFNKDKVDWGFELATMSVTDGQVAYERLHLLKKLEVRDAERHRQVVGEKTFGLHPMFILVEGDVEDWEIV